MKLHPAFFILGAAVAIGCGGTLPQPPAQFSLPPVDVQPLVGDWRGNYVANGTAERHGTLTFSLVGGTSDAHGTVTMSQAGADRAFARYRSEQTVMTSEDATPRVEMPAIQFVRLQGSTVSATIDAFLDPDCQCPAVMTLAGKLHGDTIDGTFRATYDAKRPDMTGTWSVSRGTPATTR